MVVTQLLYFTYALIKRYLLVANGDDRRVSPVRVETGISISFLTPPTYSLAGHRERGRPNFVTASRKEALTNVGTCTA